MDYQDSFKYRVDSFLYAINKYPNCYDNELLIAIEMLDPKSYDTIVNLGGGGINLNKFLNKDINYIPLEFNSEFSKICNIPLCSFNQLPFQNDTIDKFLILALLHHFTIEERDILYKEIFRSLKKDGVFVLSDVIINSKQDIWLNQVVDKFNPFGHKGKFFDENDKNLLLKNNFDVKVSHKKYFWEFTDENEMIQFMKHLFYLQIDNQKCLELLNNTFNISINNKYSLEWELIYFICKK